MTPEQRFKEQQRYAKSLAKLNKKMNDEYEERERKNRIWWSNNGHDFMHRQFNM